MLRPHRIAIGAYELQDGKLVRTERIELDVDGARTAVPQLTGRRKPAVLLLNDDDLSYAKVRLDEDSLAFVTEHLGAFADSLPRALCWASAWDMTRDGELAARDYLTLALSGLPRESDIGVVQSVHRQVRAALDVYTDPAWREQGLGRWAAAAEEQLRAAEPGSDHQLAWTRALAAVARTDGQLALLMRPAGRLGRAQGPGRRHRAALDAARPAGRHRPRRRQGHRGRTRPGPHGRSARSTPRPAGPPGRPPPPRRRPGPRWSSRTS